MKTLLFTLASISILSFAGLAQTDTSGLTPDVDSTITKASLTLGVSYANNAAYYGQRAEESMPYAAGSATYRLRSGIYFSAVGYRLLNDSASVVSATSLGAGISFKLSERVLVDFSYSHTFYPSRSPFLQAANTDNLSASLTFEGWLNTTANADYVFGKSKDVFVTMGIGKSVSLGSISNKDLISISPSIDIVGGTQHFYESYVSEKRLRDSLLGLPLPPLFGGSDVDNDGSTRMSTSFDILSYNLKFPISYSRASYMFEVGYQLSLLGRKVASDPAQINSFLTTSFYYQF